MVIKKENTKPKEITKKDVGHEESARYRVMKK
jgi:hypothetical protein